MRRMMREIDAAQFPYELIDIEIAAQMSKLNRALNELGEKLPPPGFHFENLVADASFDIVEFKEPCSDRASARQSRALGPSKPVGKQSAQARQTIVGAHRGGHDAALDEIGHVVEQLDLHVFLGAEMGKQPALGHPDLVGEHAQRDPAQPGLAHERKSLAHDFVAGGGSGIAHEYKKARPVVFCQPQNSPSVILSQPRRITATEDVSVRLGFIQKQEMEGNGESAMVSVYHPRIHQIGDLDSRGFYYQKCVTA